MASSIATFLFFIVHCQSSNILHMDERIVNGIPSNASLFPYIASLSIAFSGNNFYPRCGGSIFRKQYPAIILTAAHCLINTYGNRYKISVDLYRDDVHPEHDGDSGHYTHWSSLYTVYHTHFNDTTFDNDIGLIFLDANLSNYHHYKQVSIAQNITYNNSCCRDKDTLSIVGYGYNAYDGEATDTLQYSTISFMNRTKCNKALSNWYKHEYNYTGNESLWEFVTQNQICAIGNNTDACQGDSGGPLMRYNTNEQVGIISTGFGCNKQIPGIYTAIGLYYEWIYEQIDAFNARIVSTTSSLEEHTTKHIQNSGFSASISASDNMETVDGNMWYANVQLAIGCSAAGLCLLCVVVMLCVIRKQKQKKAEKYNRMKENQASDKPTKNEMEGTASAGSDVVTASTNVQIEMKDTKLITNTANAKIR